MGQNGDEKICATAGYPGPERRHCPLLEPEELERIAERAANMAVEKMTRSAYEAIGQGVVRRALFIIGLLAAAAYVYAIKEGWVKL